MIESDLPEILPDLTEVENLFTEYGSLNIRHKFTDGGDRVVNTVTVNGKTYAFGTFIGAQNDLVRKRLVKYFV